MLRNWRVKHRFLALILSTLAAFVLLSGYLLSKQSAATRSAQNLVEQDYRVMSLIGRIEGLLTRVDINILRMIAIGNPDSIAAWKAENTERFTTVDRLIDELREVAEERPMKVNSGWLVSAL